MKVIKPKKPKQYNYELRKKRWQQTVKIHGFPITARIKPTAHKQYCFLCRKLIEKGEPQMSVEAGLWYSWIKNGKLEHHFAYTPLYDSPVLVKPRIINYDEVSGVSKKIYVQRKIYLHTDCYACIMNRMWIKMGLNYLVNQTLCDSCKNRFNCYTGNLNVNLTDITYRKPTYIPSRPCEVKM